MTDSPKDRVVWAELPATDMKRAIKFYETVLGAPVREDNNGPNPTAFLPCEDDNGVAGHIYPGKPAPRGEGATVHLLPSCSLPEAMERVKQAGGEVVSEAIGIPSGKFFYAIDTEGNSIGLFNFN